MWRVYKVWNVYKVWMMRRDALSSWPGALTEVLRVVLPRISISSFEAVLPPPHPETPCSHLNVRTII